MFSSIHYSLFQKKMLFAENFNLLIKNFNYFNQLFIIKKYFLYGLPTFSYLIEELKLIKKKSVSINIFGGDFIQTTYIGLKPVFLS